MVRWETIDGVRYGFNKGLKWRDLSNFPLTEKDFDQFKPYQAFMPRSVQRGILELGGTVTPAAKRQLDKLAKFNWTIDYTDDINNLAIYTKLSNPMEKTLSYPISIEEAKYHRLNPYAWLHEMGHAKTSFTSKLATWRRGIGGFYQIADEKNAWIRGGVLAEDMGISTRNAWWSRLMRDSVGSYIYGESRNDSMTMRRSQWAVNDYHTFMNRRRMQALRRMEQVNVQAAQALGGTVKSSLNKTNLAARVAKRFMKYFRR